jgi:hypothetical protein
MRRAFWIWNIPNCEGGNPQAIADAAVRAGLTDVFVKVADGAAKFGVYEKVDKVPPVVAALKAAGLRVWGWQYVYGNDPAGEAKVATQRIQELMLDAFIVDAEMEFKQPGYNARAESYLKAIRTYNPGITLAFSSFRFPHYHMEFPWAVFFQYCDINMPQVYWLEAHNSAQQTQVCIEKFRAMSSLPLMLAGPAWKQNGWRPSPAEIQDFERVAAAHEIELVSYWSWEHCRRDLPELWPQGAPTKPPATDTAVRLAALESSDTAQDQRLKQIEDWIKSFR